MKYRLIDLHRDSCLAGKCFDDWMGKEFASKSLSYTVYHSDKVFSVVVYGINFFSNHVIEKLSHNRYFSFFGFYLDLKHVNIKGLPIRFMFKLR